MNPYKHEFISTNGITLHVVQAGTPAGPLAIFLHGFPEYWGGWQNQIPALARSGFWVGTPDLRGYNLSDKPADVAAYRLDTLADDVLGLIDAAGRDQAILIGHDWGGAVAWWLANRNPERISRLVQLNMPHHAIMRQHVRSDPGQLRKSWYVFLFQFPWLPELGLRWRDWEPLTRAIEESSRPGTFSAETLRAYKRAWLQPGAMTAMLNWYRAIVRYPPDPLPSPIITVPTFLIWGKRDVYLDHQMALPSIDLCQDGRLVMLERATHWLHHEEPERVNRLILNFLQS